MPITSPSTSTVAFNTEDQAAFVENLARVQTERRVIKLVGWETSPTANVTVKFLKIEHFPEMQDYVLDALVTARAGERTYEKVHHVSTIDQGNLVARMFQHAIDGRRRAAESLLAAVVPDLEGFFANSSHGTPSAAGAIVVPQPFEICAPKIARFLIEHYARPSTFWKGRISVYTDKPSPSVAIIELRWTDSDALASGGVNITKNGRFENHDAIS